MRTFQFLPFLEDQGIAVNIFPLFGDSYLSRLYAGESRTLTASASYARRILNVLSGRKYDLVWMEKELLPFVPWAVDRVLWKLLPPIITDFDDAIFDRYKSASRPFVRSFLGSKIERVMASSKTVIAGNSYLAEHAQKAGARKVEIVPTVVDPDRYCVTPRTAGQFRIGWIGTPKTAHYLGRVACVLARAKRELGAEIVLIGTHGDALLGLEPTVHEWTEDTEADLLSSISIGIMPLDDGDWEKGKCGYKLIQYMASGKPVVASAVGANIDIVRDKGVGYLARDDDEWFEAFRLLSDEGRRHEMGLSARKLVEEQYSVSSAAKQLSRIIREAVETENMKRLQ
ncbi:glycosyltransferase [Mesorhizobium sp.]|uniref:glycosyltransferase n=1 Tax=Mesorhizobium sp. TaxID=1871066 RepID=UPI00257B330C|nr:glycosyltransferase [Mesorhizobium sp.]